MHFSNRESRFKLHGIESCKMISAICNEPVKAMAIHNRIDSENVWSHKKEITDEKSTPFEILKVAKCRDIMLKFTDAKDEPEVIKTVQEKKLKHIMHCTQCLKTFRNMFKIVL